MKTKLLICLVALFCLSSALKITYDFDQDVCLVRSSPRGQPTDLTRIYYCENRDDILSPPNCFEKCKNGQIDDFAHRCGDPCPEGFDGLYEVCINKVNYKADARYPTRPRADRRRQGTAADCHRT